MGLLDIFKRKPKEQEKVEEPKNISFEYNGQNQKYEKQEINFMEVSEINGKNMQSIRVYLKEKMTYNNRGRVYGNTIMREYYMDPHKKIDANGSEVYDTEEYFKSMIAEGKEKIVMNFFWNEELDKICENRTTNYIGGLKIGEDGNALRTFDEDFKNSYKKTYQENKRKEEIKDRSKNVEGKLRSIDIFNEQLKAGVYTGDPIEYPESLLKEKEDIEKLKNSAGAIEVE